MQMIDAAEMVNMFSPEDLQKIVANLSPEEMDQVLDTMTLLKMKKKVIQMMEEKYGQFNNDYIYNFRK